MIIANNSDGLYGFRKELLKQLLKENHVTLCTPNDGFFSELRDLGCDIIEIAVERRGINPITDLKLLWKYIRALHTEKPGLAITYTIKPNIYGGFACRLFRIPYAANITGLGTMFQKRGLLRTIIIMMYRVALRKAKVVFFENVENKNFFIDYKIIKETQCCLLNGAGVNLEHYSYKDYPDELPIRFLFMGRIMKEKGVNELFSAMKRLRQEGLDCVLDVLGHYEEDYADQIRQYEAEGWLFYHGYQKDVRPFIEKCHCFVLPSWHEGMANTNLECAAMGRPIITSRIHGCMEAVLEGESGYLCTARDAQDLYRVMKRFLLLSNDARKQMGYSGRKHMEVVFDKKKVVEDTVKGLEI